MARPRPVFVRTVQEADRMANVGCEILCGCNTEGTLGFWCIPPARARGPVRRLIDWIRTGGPVRGSRSK